MKVADVDITDDYITVNASDTVLAVAKALAKENIPDAIVVEGDDPVGVLDDYDIVSKVVAEGKDPNSVTAKDIMYAPPKITDDTDLEEAEKIMHENEVTLLPVYGDDDKLIGAVTLMDVLEGLSKINEPKGGPLSFLRGLF